MSRRRCRRGRSRRVQRAGHVGPVGPDHLRPDRGPPVPQRPVRLPDGLHWDVLGLYARVLAGLRAPSATAVTRRARRSTRGRSTTGCSTRRRRCSATRSTTATRAPTAVIERRARKLDRRPALRHHRAAAPAVQHLYQLAAEPVHRVDRAGTAADARPARLLAHRQRVGGGDQRLHHRPARRAHRRLVRRRSSPALGLPAGCCPTPARPGELLGPADRRRAGRDRPRRRAAGHRGRVARHRLGRRRRACRRRRVSATSPAAPGRWSASSSTEPVLTEDSRRGQLHQRARRRRHDPLPAQRDGAVAAAGVACGRGSCAGRTSTSASCCWPPRRVPAGGPVVDPDDPVFLPPGDMPARIAAGCARPVRPAPGPGAVVRCILDSLALAHRRAVRDAAAAVRARRRGGAPRRRRSAQRAAVPAHRRRLRRCRWWPGRSRRPRWATCSCRPAPSAR